MQLRHARHMPIPLSQRCRRVAELLFSEPHLSQITNRLLSEASENIPFHANSNSTEMDRIRFAIMKLLSAPNSDEDSIFDLAKRDWRDLFMAAGFAYSADEHESWYNHLVPNNPGPHASSPKPWWAFWRN